MRTLILIAMASLLAGCVHQPSTHSPSGGAGNPPMMTALGQPVSAAMRAQKQECEKLLNVALPFAQDMLSQHHELHPFGSALTSNGQIISTARYPTKNRLPAERAVAVLEKGLQQGASSGRYIASSLVLDVEVVPPGRSEKQHAIAIRLDHRGGYSVIVFYPYEISASGSLAIERPFSAWGAQKIFPQ